MDAKQLDNDPRTSRIRKGIARRRRQMGFETRVGYSDNVAVEDFLATESDPGAFSGVVLSAKHLKRHENVVETARARGVPIIVDTLTDRLAAPGFGSGTIDYGLDLPLDVDSLKRLNEQERRAFVRSILYPQFRVDADVLVGPHFYAEALDEIPFNVELARATVRESRAGRPVRAILAARRQLLSDPNTMMKVVSAYAGTGIEQIELRLSPLGGEDETAGKIGSTFSLLRAVKEHSDLEVILGHQGLIGESAFATGLVSAFSSGIGEQERYDHKGLIYRQTHPRRDEDGKSKGGRTRRVLLPGADAQVPKKIAEKLFTNPAIRGRLACGIDSCRDSIGAPAQDARKHLLHSRAGFVRDVQRRPVTMRATVERNRLAEALGVRRSVNKLLESDEEASPIGTRTLESLIGAIDPLIRS